MTEVEKLKERIVSYKESAEKDLDSFIKEKWSQSEENTKNLEELMDRYEIEHQFSSN